MEMLSKHRFKSNLFLAPMESCSDVAFRTLCYEQGAALTYIEMIRAYAITKKKKAMLEKLDPSPSIRQGLQLAAVKVNELKKTLLYIKKQREEHNPRFEHIETIDLNLGCPSPGLISEGAGPALLKRTNRVRELFETLKSTWNGPVSAKMRLGMNGKEKKNKVYLHVLEKAEETGLDWITIHPKTVDTGSMEPVDLNVLKECVGHTSVPIIGNGWVIDGDSGEKMLKTGVQGMMIARAAVGDPWVFKRIAHYQQTGRKLQTPTKEEYTAALEQYLKIAGEYKIPEYYREYHKNVFTMKINGTWDHFHTPKTIEKWV